MPRTAAIARIVRRASRKRLTARARAHYALLTFDLPLVGMHAFENLLPDRDFGPAYSGDYLSDTQRVGLV